MGEIALGAAGFLADQPHRLELAQKIGGRLVDMQHPVHRGDPVVSWRAVNSAAWAG